MTDARPIALMLVENDPADAELILLSLGESDTGRIVHLHDGQEALDLLLSADGAEDRLPRVLFLDLKLQGVGGLDVLRELRRHPRTARLPVVMLTSSRLQDDVSRAYRLGANSYVQKPVGFEEFRDKVRRLASYWLEVNEPPPPPRPASQDG